MNIDIVCINYQSYRATYDLLDSVNNTLTQSSCECTVNLHIIDNSHICELDNIKQKVDRMLLNTSLNVFLIKESNNGYFGTISNYISSILLDKCDALVISNSDILVEKDYFDNLTALWKIKDKFSDAFCFVPFIGLFSSYVDDNPRFKDKYPLHKYFFQFLQMKFYFVYALRSSLIRINNCFFLRLRSYLFKTLLLKVKPNILPSPILLPVGVQFIFFKPSSRFILPRLTFLYGEEVIIALMALLRGEKIYHVPQIRIYHQRSMSVQTLNHKFKWNLLSKSFNYTSSFLRHGRID